MTVVAFEPPAPDDCLIRCRRCNEPLAERWPGGGMRIIAPRPYVDRDGRLVVQCEKCGHKNRLLKAA